MALGKVASYIKNLGKSVAYASIHEFDESMPAVAEYREANAAAAKELYHAITNFKGTVKKIKTAVETSRIYEAAEYGFHNALDDLSTGNWYNKEREQSGEGSKDAAKAMGLDESDFDMNDDMFKDLDNMFNDESFKDLEPGDQATIKSIEGTSKATANTIANATITGAKYQSEVSKINTNMIFAQQERWFGQLNSGISTMNDNVNTINKFNMDVFQKHIDNSTTFFDNITKDSKELNAMFKEFLGMYRNEYKVRQKASEANDKALAAKKHNEDDPLTYYDLVNPEGSVDIGKYIKHVQNQTYKVLNEQFGQEIFGPKAKGNFLKVFAENPLGFVMESAIKGLIGPGLKQSMDYFNNMVSGVFGTVMARLSDSATSYGGIFKENLSRIFAPADLKAKMSQSLRTDKYTKGQIPFDGITKKAIVDVIPELLGDILAEISNGPHRRFDYNAGQWTSLEALTKEDRYRRQATEREAASLFNHVMLDPKNLAVLASSENERKTILESYFSTFIPFLQNSHMNLQKVIKAASSQDPEKLSDLITELFGSGISPAKGQQIAKMLLDNTSKQDRMMAANEYYSTVSRFNKSKKDENAETGVNNSRYVENGAADTLGHATLIKDKDGKLYLSSESTKLFDINGNRRFEGKRNLASELDDQGHNIFTYLQNIDANISGLYNTANNFALDYGSLGTNTITQNDILDSYTNPYNTLNRNRDINWLNKKINSIKEKSAKNSKINSYLKNKLETKNEFNYDDPIFHNDFAEQTISKYNLDQKYWSSENTKFKIIKSIISEDLDTIDFSKITNNNIDKIISDKKYRLSYLNKMKKTDILDLNQQLPYFDINSTIIKLIQDINTLQAKRKYILGVTANNSSSNLGKSVIGLDKIKFHDEAKESREKLIDEKLAKAAGIDLKDYSADNLTEIFEKMLDANGEKKENGHYTTTSSSSGETFHKALDKTLNRLGEYGFDPNSPEGKILIGTLAEKWNLHYGIKPWHQDDYGTGNSVFTFTRGINARDNLKAALTAKDKEFDWDEFEKKSFADKFSSVDSLGEKWDVIMMQVGKMVEAPARMMSNVFRSAGDSIYSFFFEDDTEYIDSEGKKIEGFFGLMKAKTVNALDSLVQGFDKNIWIPLKEEFGLGVESLSDSLGLSWLLDKYGRATKNAFTELGNNLNDFFFSGGLKKAEDIVKKEKKTDKDTTKTEGESEGESTKKQDEERLREVLVDLIQNSNNEVEEKASGARMINKSGLTAISKGEMIIPSELNPFYKGTTNKQSEIRNEKRIKNGLGKYVSNMIGMNANGNLTVAAETAVPTSVESYVAILNNLQKTNPKVYNEVIKTINASGQTMTKENAASKIMAILSAHKDDKTPEEQAEYNKLVDIKAEGTFVKRVTGYMQSSLSKVVLNTKNPTVIKMWDDFIKNDSETVGNGIAGGTIGALAGLLTGFGPLAGMVVGAGANIVMGSETVKSTLFGEKDDKGNRSGGALLSATEYKYLSKLIPDIGKFGLIGAGAGLFGLAPFGILGGIGIGAMAAFAKNNSSFMETLFGDVDGIIDKDKKAFLKKAMPNMLLGTVATYALGPFGLLGSMILGSAGGMVATSEKFKSIMLGDKLMNGERSGGLLGELKDRFVSPLANFAKDFVTDVSGFVYRDIITPFAKGVGPIVRLTGIVVQNTAKTLWDGVKKVIGLTPEGGWLKDIWTGLMSPIIGFAGKTTGGAINLVKNIAEPILSVPSKLVEKVGNKANEWMLGNGYSAGMTARDRLAWSEQHGTGLVGKSSIWRDNDRAMLKMKDNQLVEAENLARYIKSNGKGTEKVLAQSKDNLKTNMRSLLGVQNLTGEQDRLIEQLLSSDINTREEAEAKIKDLFAKNHINDEKTRNAFNSTIDVMRKQQENLTAIQSGGIDAAKKRFAELGFKGDPTKVLSLLSNEVKDRNIFSKLEEVAESQTPAEKQINATEQVGDKIVTATQDSANQITEAVNSITDQLLAMSDKFTEYIRDPEKFRNEQNDYNKKIDELSEKIRITAESGTEDTSKLVQEKNQLIRDRQLRDMMLSNTDYIEFALGKDIDSIMTNGDDKHFGSKDAVKLHKNYNKEAFVDKVNALKKNNLWTDSFNTILNLKEDQFPVLDAVGALYKKHADGHPRWSLIDALSFNKSDISQIDTLMESNLMPKNLGWYVDHKNSLKDFQKAIVEYNGILNADTDTYIKQQRTLGILKSAIGDAKETKNSKESSNILAAASFEAKASRIDTITDNKVDAKIITVTNPETGKPMQYTRSTDGSLSPYDAEATKWENEMKNRKQSRAKNPFGYNPFGYNSDNEFNRQLQWINTKDKIGKGINKVGKGAKWIGRKTKEAGGFLGSLGSLFGSILGPILGGGGIVTAGILGGGYLLGKIPGLADFAGKVLISGVNMLANAAGAVFTKIIDNAPAIASEIYNTIKNGLTRIVEIAFGFDRSDEDLKREKGILKDENGKYYRVNSNGENEYLSDKELEEAKSRKSVFGALKDVTSHAWDNSNNWGKAGMILGGTAATAYTGYKMATGALNYGRNVRDKWRGARNSWRKLLGKKPIDFGNSGFSPEVQAQIESRSENTAALDRVTEAILNSNGIFSDSASAGDIFNETWKKGKGGKAPKGSKMPKGGKNKLPNTKNSSGTISKILNYAKKLPFVGSIGTKLTPILSSIGKGLLSVGKVLPGISLVILASNIYGAWEGYNNAEELIQRSGRDLDGQNIGIVGKVACGIAQCISDLTGGIVSPETILSWIPDSLLFSEPDKKETINNKPIEKINTPQNNINPTVNTAINKVNTNIANTNKSNNNDIQSPIKPIEYYINENNGNVIKAKRARDMDIQKFVAREKFKENGGIIPENGRVSYTTLVTSEDINKYYTSKYENPDISKASVKNKPTVDTAINKANTNIINTDTENKPTVNVKYNESNIFKELSGKRIEDQLLILEKYIPPEYLNAENYIKKNKNNIQQASRTMRNYLMTELQKIGLQGKDCQLYAERLTNKYFSTYDNYHPMAALSINPNGAGKYGRGYFKQTDPRFASQRFNTNNDSQYQTIGDSGCGPIAAVNALYGTGPDPIEASKFALEHGYKEVNGGTKPGFFKAFFNKNGKDAEYTENSDTILKNLAAGNKVVLEGQSNKIDTDTPFGTGPHYVTATGLNKNGDIIIQDPQDSRSNIPFNADKVLSKTKFGIAAKGKYGRGEDDIIDKLLSNIKSLINHDENASITKNHNGFIETSGDSNIIRAWKFFKNQGFSNEAIAGILGNFIQESNMDPTVHENYKDLGPNPVDGVGFGIAQWTYSDRQKPLIDFAKKNNKPVNTLDPQLNFVYKEMQEGGPNKTVDISDYEKSIGDPGKYAYLFHRDFEISADSENAVRATRGKYADDIYNKYKNISGAGKYGRGEDKGSELADNIVNSLLNDFGFDSNIKSSADREARKVDNNINPVEINKALNWAENRVNQKGEGNNGCTTFVNQFLSKANNSKKDWMWVPNVVRDAKFSNIWKDPTEPANPGDIAVLETNGTRKDGADHVVIATGDGNYIGNSSSKNKIWKGNLGKDFGAENVVGYVKTGNPNAKGTITTGKATRSIDDMIKDSGTSATKGKGKYGRGFNTASVNDFVYGNQKDINMSQVNDDYNISKHEYENLKNQAGRGTESVTKDYTNEFKEIITLLAQIAENTKGSNEIGVQNREALNKLASQTAKRLSKANASGLGKVDPNIAIDDIDDMMTSMYEIAQR